jgi:uncharacterized glyoxalase superfamily protein PhnB
MSDHPVVDQLDRIIDVVLGGAAAQDSLPEMTPLAEVAGLLRHLPSQDFKRRLKVELLGSVSMSATHVRARFRIVSPLIIHERAPELVDFLTWTFNAREVTRDTTEQAYGFYSEVQIGDSAIMIGGGTAARRSNLPGAFHVYVEDCDATYARALAAGATTLAGETGKPADRPYGERSAFVEDGFGNYWYIATRLTSGRPAEGPGEELGSVVPFLHPQGARKQIAFLRAAFGAEELAVIEHEGRVMHGAVRIGDAVLEMGEPADRSGIPPGGFFVRVDDVEAAYARALAAGAESVRMPDDIPYGYRSAIVRDPEGYLWWTARVRDLR